MTHHIHYLVYNTDYELSAQALKEIDMLTASAQNTSKEVVDHATHLCSLLTMSRDEYERVFLSEQSISIHFVYRGYSEMRSLTKIYENGSPEIFPCFQRQLTTLLKRYLQVLAYISLKVFKDLNSTKALKQIRKLLYIFVVCSYA